ncbi:hypothetical protein KCP76_01405 [Salmonella enterica subsp. enterica serovar Weltevreden]|nr:hypothetical protein KCP76_01405 [Salmonella enterica subsp. enterica serovar Weltevreden]
MIIYLIMAVSAGREYVEATFSGGQISGVRHYHGNHPPPAYSSFCKASGSILAEIVPALLAFQKKLVPNARPALDCPVVAIPMPNAVLR